MLSFNRLFNSLAATYPNADQNIHNEHSSLNLSNTNSTIELAVRKSVLWNGSRTILCNSSCKEIEEPRTKSLIDELDLKYSLIFIINFQVILFNALIIAHVLKAKQFQKSSSARFFVASLALSDMLVGLMVMPLGIISLMEDTWLFGKEMCVLWQLIDFFSCTASIFNLCTVSIDRYIAISKPLLYMRLGPTRVLLIIGVVWLVSALITFPPVISERFQKGDLYLDGICKGQNCSNCGSLFDLYPVYVVLSTILSFFVPVLVVIITNYRTYLIVKRHMFARSNNGRIRNISAPTSKEKLKKPKFFANLMAGRKENSRQIELDSLENQQKKSQKVPIVLAKQLRHNFCYCDRGPINNRTYLHTSTAKTNLTCTWLSRCCNRLMCHECWNTNSEIIESKIIHTAHHNPHYSSCDYHHPRNDNLKESEPRGCGRKLAGCLTQCCSLSNLCNLSGRQSRFSSFRDFFILNNNSSNVEILDGLSKLNNLKTCGYCALNSLNSLQFHKTNHQTNHQTKCGLFLNEQSLIVDDESTSESRSRVERDRDERSISLLVNSHSCSESNAINDEMTNETSNSLSLNEANAVESNGLPNGCLIRGRIKESNKAVYFQSQSSDCCGYCCTLCSTECDDCKNDFKRLLTDIFNSQVNHAKSANRSNNKENRCKIGFIKTSGNKADKMKTSCTLKRKKCCEPQHHFNCSHFKINQPSQNNKTFIRCDYCGNTLHQNQSSKKLCLHRFAKGEMSQKQADNTLSKNHFQGQKYGQIKLHFIRANQQMNHHCVHSHIQHFNNNQLNPIFTDQMSSESITRKDDSSHSALNSSEKCDEASSSTSQYRRANKSSFDDELRINCGTGQLQKSIGLNWSQKNTIERASSTNSDGLSNRSGSATKLKKLAYFAGNSVRSVGFRSSSSNNRLNTIRREYKATKTLAIITFVFVSMWLPYFTIFLLEAICKDCFLVKNYFSPFLSHCLFLGWSNSYVNCLLYMYFSRKLRNSIINSLLCRKI